MNDNLLLLEIGVSVDPVLSVQIFTSLALLLGLLFEYAWLSNNQNRASLAGPIIGILIHTGIYYLVLFITMIFPVVGTTLHGMFPLLFSNWSAILRCHSITALATMAGIRWYYDAKLRYGVTCFSIKSFMLLMKLSLSRKANT